jgi:hypothetical protein
MENNNNSLLVKFDRVKMQEVISTSNLSENDKQELSKQLMSNEISVLSSAMQKLADSGVAQNDISNFLNELRDLNKQGMYATTKLEAKTGSGKIEMQFKGGDTKLIIPVLIIVAIVVISALVIIFWR